MPRAGAEASGASLWTVFAALVGFFFGRWTSARTQAAQAEALSAALDRCTRLEAEVAQLRDEAAQRADAALPPVLVPLPRPIVRVKIHQHRPKRRRRL